ncbi:MAG TPA: EAL domain-containing response regulator [Terracidiphilus sp.]|nr:EAL domain-containing response regulator [Terracidiphilus sp.]
MTRPRRLLILDDEVDVARTMAEMAELAGFDVKTTTLPEKMRELLREWKPSHLAIDLIMPGMDGVEVLRTLAADRCDAEIILTSGIGMKVLETARHSAIKRGLNVIGVLPKPFKREALHALLDHSAAAATSARGPRLAPGPQAIFTVNDLLEALHADQFVLHYQPKVRLADGEIVGVEALVRWQHPTEGLVYPDRFIQVAESSSVMFMLTYQIFDIGLKWLDSLGSGLPICMSMNISASSLTEQDLVDRLYWACLKYRIDPKRVTLELTESSAVNHSAVALDVLSRLRIKGFSLSIDDFGTGYSTMTQLSQLPFSELKVDRSFVASMHENMDSMTIVESTINLARSLGLTTVAEGVEDGKTMHALRQLGCELAQGFLFSRPMSSDDARAAIRAWDGSRFDRA